MSICNLEIYEQWSLEFPTIPTRSRFYHLEPIGIGTPIVESLSSYICRLALAHCVSPGVLIRQQTLSNAYGIYEDQPLVASLPSIGYALKINGTGAVARRFVHRLETLTFKSNLERLTMLAWSQKTVALADPCKCYRAWCPQCYQDWRHLEQVIYEPLLWSWTAVIVCPRHCQLLQTICPSCGQNQQLIQAKMRPGYCCKCQQWLGFSSDCQPSQLQTTLDHLEFNWHIWVAQTIQQVLAVGSSSLPKAIRSRIANVIHNLEKLYICDDNNYALITHQIRLLAMLVNRS